MKKKNIDVEIVEPKDPLEAARQHIEKAKGINKPVIKWKLNRSLFNIKYWRDLWHDRTKPDRTVLINLELINGMHKSFIVKEKDQGFKYKKGLYIFDDDSKYFNIDAKMWCFDFHESYCLPIKRVIPIGDIKKAVEAADITEVEYASNPMTLERFIISRVAEGIMKGQQIDEFMKQIRLLLVIAMVASVVHLLLFMQKSGMFAQVKLPF